MYHVTCVTLTALSKDLLTLYCYVQCMVLFVPCTESPKLGSRMVQCPWYNVYNATLTALSFYSCCSRSRHYNPLVVISLCLYLMTLPYTVPYYFNSQRARTLEFKNGVHRFTAIDILQLSVSTKHVRCETPGVHLG